MLEDKRAEKQAAKEDRKADKQAKREARRSSTDQPSKTRCSPASPPVYHLFWDLTTGLTCLLSAMAIDITQQSQPEERCPSPALRKIVNTGYAAQQR